MKLALKRILGSDTKNGISPTEARAYLAASGLFQHDWYLARYPEVAKTSLAPIDHYLKVGEQADFKPNPFFDPSWYRGHAKGARKFAGPIVLHYAVKGWKNDRDPSRAFSTRLYLNTYPYVADTGLSPLEHYLQRGKLEGTAAFPKSLANPETGPALIEDMRTIAASRLFAADWYTLYHADFWNMGKDIDPLFHYATEGWRQGRKPNPIFEPHWYCQHYHESIDAKANPLVHYIKSGEKAGYQAAPNFSPKTYFKRHRDLDPATTSPLLHYLQNGFGQGEKKPEPVLSTSSDKEASGPAKLPVDPNLRGMIDFQAKPLTPDTLVFNSEALDIHWVIPDFAPGGGGHMTIFRMASHLERAGHKQTIWINNPSINRSEQEAADNILKHFQQFTGDVRFLDERFDEAKGDAIIASDCWTVWPVLSAANFKRRFYFVQDFEPSFFPMGSQYLAAEQTYHQDLDCICASPWLAKLMTEKYDRWARPFWLAADTELYHPPKQKQENKVPRIAFYARHFTARRAVELGFLALEVLARRGLEFKVDFFGAPVEFADAPFPFKDHGVASPEELADLFRGADIGVVFSATNYSLVPQEMMACGLPIVEMQGESTECIFPEGTVSLAAPHPDAIADSIAALMADKSKRQEQSAAAIDWVKSFSWPESAGLVEAAFKKRLTEIGEDRLTAKASPDSPKASVVIPTLNAGPILDRVLEAVSEQQTPWPFEVLVIDSGSTDETLETIAKYPQVRLHQIEKKDFNHGGTRNLGVELTSGEFIAFLTHDALPANPRWLYNLVSSLEAHPEAAGAFGKHLPYPEASGFTKRDLTNHFEGFLAHPLCLSRDTNKKLYVDKDQGWRQLLHFYSDNNSIMRRSVWQDIPYRAVKFGEDQVWADDIIKAGHSKVYAVRAVVYHSHDFDTAETHERSMTESAFFKHFFDYDLIPDEKALRENLAEANAVDEAWGEEQGLDRSEIEERFAQNEARLRGYLDGCLTDTSEMF